MPLSTACHPLHFAAAAAASPPGPAQSASLGAQHDELALKLMIFGRRKPGTTRAEHRHHIRHVHGELVLGYIAAEPENAPRRYVQNTVFDGYCAPATLGSPGNDPFALQRDFVTEIWFPDEAALVRSRDTDFYRDRLQGDEDNFVDQANVVFMPVRERLLTERSAIPAGSVKLFGALQKAPSVDAEAFYRASATLPAALKTSPLAPLIQRHVRNDVLPTPKGTAPLHVVDEIWLDEKADARALLEQWRSWVGEALVRPGFVTPAGHFALLGNEQVLHAGLG